MRQLEAKVIFDIAEHEGVEDWRVNQEILVALKDVASTISLPYLYPNPVINKLHPSTKTEA